MAVELVPRKQRMYSVLHTIARTCIDQHSDIQDTGVHGEHTSVGGCHTGSSQRWQADGLAGGPGGRRSLLGRGKGVRASGWPCEGIDGNGAFATADSPSG